jgi:hypothetical protein
VVRIVVRWLREALDAEGRLAQSFRTLLLSPGRLSRQYVDGQRASQLSPVRLLAASLFMTTALLWGGGTVLGFVMDGLNVELPLEEGELSVDQIPESMPRIDFSSDDDQRIIVFGPGFHYYRFEGPGIEAEEYVDTVALPDIEECEGWQSFGCLADEFDATWASRQAQSDFAMTLGIDGPDDTASILETVFRTLVITGVCMIPVVWLLGAAGRTWVDATVIIVHWSAVAILLLGVLALAALPLSLATGAQIEDLIGPMMLVHGVAVPAYLAFALRGHYDLGWWSTLWRGVAVLVVYQLVIVLVFGVALDLLNTLDAMNAARG